MSKNLLDIVTKVNRPTITIDGARFEMRDPGELSMAEFHLLSTHGAALTQAGEAYAEDPDGAYEKIQASMNALLDLVTPDLPAAVREKLNPFHVQQLLDSFTKLARIKPAPGERRQRRKSSRGSAGSTPAARHKTG